MRVDILDKAYLEALDNLKWKMQKISDKEFWKHKIGAIYMPPVKKADIKRFSEEIEEIVWDKDVTYIEAVLMFCEINELEVEVVPKFISKKLQARIREEADKMSLLKSKDKRLPI